MFDLSQFDKAPVFTPDNQIGVVLSLPLTLVIEDPGQPRTEFDTEELSKLAEDISRRGVQSPIAVRPPVDGMYQIIHGARRFRASGLAGVATIPAIVQIDEVAFDDYSQVLENTQRDNLSPMDIARFIQKRKELGESNAEIARNLSEKPEWVTSHLALIDLPPIVQMAYDAGLIKGAKNTYELRKLHSKDPDAVARLVDTGEEITRKQIVEVSVPKAQLIRKRHESTSTQVETDNAEAQNPVSVELKPQRVEATHPAESAISETPEVQPVKLASPCVIGIYEGNPVQVLIQFKPSEPGYAWIHHPGTAGQQEVLADQITLSRIEEKHP